MYEYHKNALNKILSTYISERSKTKDTKREFGSDKSENRVGEVTVKKTLLGFNRVVTG